MAETTVANRVSQAAHMELMHGDRLIYACQSPISPAWAWYEAYRGRWLTKHRNRPAPLSFRQGKHNPLTVAYFVLTLIWR